MFRRYGSWPEAIAAYNWGPRHLDEWIGGGRPADKFPATVDRYRTRGLGTSGLPAAAGGEPGYPRGPHRPGRRRKPPPRATTATAAQGRGGAKPRPPQPRVARKR